MRHMQAVVEGGGGLPMTNNCAICTGPAIL